MSAAPLALKRRAYTPFPLASGPTQTTTKLPSPATATCFWAPSSMNCVPPVVELASVSPPSATACRMPWYSAWPASVMSLAAWIAPVAYSRIQSPPWRASPVRFSLAATSAPVRRASASTKARPSAVEATSQP